MADRYYIPTDLGPGPLAIDGPEAHHLAHVCRVRPGDAVCLFNGDGREYPARVTAVGKRAVAVEVTGVESPARERPHRLEVLAALPKGDRAQFLVEKLTELGVTRFVPLVTARGAAAPREAKRDKLERWVVEASKQCGRNRLMEVGPPTEWAAACAAAYPGRKLFAHVGETGGVGGPGDVVAAVGPEGGWTDDEVAMARAAGWQVVGLGLRVLRVETAAIVLAALAG